MKRILCRILRHRFGHTKPVYSQQAMSCFYIAFCQRCGQDRLSKNPQ